MIKSSIFEPYVRLCESVTSAKVVTVALQDAGLSRATFDPPPVFLPYRLQATFAENLARATGERHFGALLSDHVPYEALGQYAQYVLAAENLGGAIKRGIDVLPCIMRGVTIDCSSNSDTVELKFDTHLGNVIGHNQIEEGFIISLIKLVRLYTKSDWVPDAVGLMNNHNGRHDEAEQIYQTKVTSTGDISGIQFSKSLLKNTILDKNLKSEFIVKGDLEGLDPGNCGYYTDTVRSCIMVAIRSGDISLDAVSNMLGIGPRTLQRMLMSESESYQTCLDMVRRERAIQLLTETSLSIDSIAQHLGFAEPNSFRRAFRKWHNMSAQQYRKAYGAIG